MNRPEKIFKNQISSFIFFVCNDFRSQQILKFSLFFNRFRLRNRGQNSLSVVFDQRFFTGSNARTNMNCFQGSWKFSDFYNERHRSDEHFVRLFANSQQQNFSFFIENFHDKRIFRRSGAKIPMHFTKRSPNRIVRILFGKFCNFSGSFRNDFCQNVTIFKTDHSRLKNLPQAKSTQQFLPNKAKALHLLNFKLEM